MMMMLMKLHQYHRRIILSLHSMVTLMIHRTCRWTSNYWGLPIQLHCGVNIWQCGVGTTVLQQGGSRQRGRAKGHSIQSLESICFDCHIVSYLNHEASYVISQCLIYRPPIFQNYLKRQGRPGYGQSEWRYII
jgi:hypothetical protein